MKQDEKHRLLDDEHLRLLRIGYIISGAANALWIVFGNQSWRDHP